VSFAISLKLWIVVCEPAMDGQHHLAGLRLIGERLIPITEPQELVLSVTLADVHAQLDERLIYNSLITFY